MQLIPSHANLDPDYMLDDMVTVDGLWNLDLFRENFKRTIDESWKTVWKFQGPQRVRLFMWLALKQRLLTNIKRVGRGIVQDPSYPVCAHASGDLYVLEIAQQRKRYASASVVQDHFSDWFVGFNYNLGKAWVVGGVGILDRMVQAVCTKGLFGWDKSQKTIGCPTVTDYWSFDHVLAAATD
ncbi:hypothetical protein Goklo_020888 [Gossypium klotzschianum]|uniref:Reverse transcriptase zinc-binding domain-containing protein n=1 Tax=Gossypium klotzschianum TaxID=34286 RepID=A0A7J8UTN1_9ROSI|nr:hypothetical protein [Gossypium klotzschianum]